MTDNNNQPKPSSWIVLVQKNPVGPLDESEIREKLATGEIRINDLAHAVHLEMKSDQLPSDWRFLWQFPEFDRRKKVSPPGTYTERRRVTPQELEETRVAGIPAEFREITEKELVERSKSAWNRERNALGVSNARGIAEPTARNRRDGHWVYWPAALLLVAVVLPAFLGFSPFSATETSPSAPTAKPRSSAGRVVSGPKIAVESGAPRWNLPRAPKPEPMPQFQASERIPRADRFRHGGRFHGTPDVRPPRVANGLKRDRVGNPIAPREELSLEEAVIAYPSPYDDGDPFRMHQY